MTNEVETEFRLRRDGEQVGDHSRDGFEGLVRHSKHVVDSQHRCDTIAEPRLGQGKEQIRRHEHRPPGIEPDAGRAQVELQIAGDQLKLSSLDALRLSRRRRPSPAAPPPPPPPPPEPALVKSKVFSVRRICPASRTVRLNTSNDIVTRGFSGEVEAGCCQDFVVKRGARAKQPLLENV